MKALKIAGWVLGVLVSAFLLFGSAMGKFTEWEGKQQLFDHLGWTAERIAQIGIVEVVLAVLILVPRVDLLATVLLTGYLGGATATHVRVGDPFYFPIVIGVLAWAALAMRSEDLRTFTRRHLKG